MTNEKIEFANLLKRKINHLDGEIQLLMDLFPPVRSANRLGAGKRGWLQKIRSGKLIHKKLGLVEREIELSNEDIRALTDIRTAEREALQQVLEELE
ncbi:hypothetical protein [uncultured Acetatifactor sp.]|mgnify:CR=1 FL=1|jgi:hypothetical protein|uniref:hypothetical protein n=1 Tax=uncultured Acetatifactor sp. TaxID=1671927 RepID=UPI00263487EA|nr:hypothetical protein [uncultured Acetatifactor sp.]